MRTYLYGYEGKRLTADELDKKWTWNMVHPEMRRRLMRLINCAQDAGHDVGIGSGARDPARQLAEALARHVVVTNPTLATAHYKGVYYRLKDKTSPYAFPGSSNHEIDILEGYALGVDVNGWEDHWFDKNCERFGLKNFGGKIGPGVNGEEWHAQPIEFSNSRSAVNREVAAGKRLAVIPLPMSSIEQQYTPPVTLPPVAVPTPPVLFTKDISMIIIDLYPNTPLWTAMLLFGDRVMHIVSGKHVDVLTRGGVPRVTLKSEDELLGILQSVSSSNASPFADGKPAANTLLHAAWY